MAASLVGLNNLLFGVAHTPDLRYVEDTPQRAKEHTMSSHTATLIATLEETPKSFVGLYQLDTPTSGFTYVALATYGGSNPASILWPTDAKGKNIDYSQTLAKADNAQRSSTLRQLGYKIAE